MKVDYNFKRIYNRKDVYAKQSKRVLIGDKEYCSIAEAARALRIYPSSLTNALKKGHLKDGTKVSVIKESK